MEEKDLEERIGRKVEENRAKEKAEKEKEDCTRSAYGGVQREEEVIGADGEDGAWGNPNQRHWGGGGHYGAHGREGASQAGALAIN